jgi:hypothetical protein
MAADFRSGKSAKRGVIVHIMATMTCFHPSNQPTAQRPAGPVLRMMQDPMLMLIIGGPNSVEDGHPEGHSERTNDK